jgi:hypothetical protein
MANPLTEQLTRQSDEIVERIRPMLAGKAPPLQGIIVAELTALFIAGHHPDLREQLIKVQDATVRELVALWHDRLWPKEKD